MKARLESNLASIKLAQVVTEARLRNLQAATVQDCDDIFDIFDIFERSKSSFADFWQFLEDMENLLASGPYSKKSLQSFYQASDAFFAQTSALADSFSSLLRLQIEVLARRLETTGATLCPHECLSVFVFSEIDNILQDACTRLKAVLELAGEGTACCS
jgi:hypothetical protein